MVFADPSQLSSAPNVEAETAYNSGLKFASNGQYDLAIQSFEKATTLDPRHHKALAAAGDVFVEMGNPLSAADCFALAINVNGGVRSYKEKFITNIRQHRFGQRNDDLRGVILKCLKTDDILHQDLAPLWLSDLELDRDFKSLLQKLDGNPSYKIFKKTFEKAQPAFLDDPFFLLGLSRLAVHKKSFENFIKYLRRWCAEQGAENCALELLQALADYAFRVEHIFSADEDVEFDPKASLANLALCAAYEPLYKRDDAEELLAHYAGEPFLKTHIEEPLALQKRARHIEALVEIKDGTSKAVQQQYEDFPYPRWNAFEPLLKNEEIEAPLKGREIKVLIAGCGTGREAIELAAALPQADVLAIDLSRVSLAYAQAKAEHFGIENVTFKHADILELGVLEERFDYITSSGVLHHMKDPKAGWSVLNGLLKPDGLMRIALYSEQARAGIVKSRDVIAKENIDDDLNGIRDFRDNVTALVGAQTQAYLEKYIDYYYTSECRDLLFHVQEHRFTLPQIKDILDEFGLAFLGFHLPPAIFDQYHKIYKDDPAALNLDHWDAFEGKHPDTFKIMYRFWCRKT